MDKEQKSEIKQSDARSMVKFEPPLSSVGRLFTAPKKTLLENLHH